MATSTGLIPMEVVDRLRHAQSGHGGGRKAVLVWDSPFS
ncbi:MAG: hypothetical protein K0Q73_3918 [Paenibacillus sp.]|jgi:hypothetical protein|nr:hypothetical protein [Paenibacillus sp.]